jgi:hypothetical protein
MPALFDEEIAFVFDYKLGSETQLQWDLSGLNASQELKLWILATEGPNAATGSGLVHALRREYLFWDIQFLIFPVTFSEDKCRQALKTLPACMVEEPDIIFFPTGELGVPQLVPLIVDNPLRTRSSLSARDLASSEALVSIHAVSGYPQFTAIMATVTQQSPDFAVNRQGWLAIGLQRNPPQGCVIVKLAPMTVIPRETRFSLSDVHLIPGLLISVLARSGLNGAKAGENLSVLVTHCDTVIGSTVCNILLLEGLKVSRVDAAISLLELACMGPTGFNLIISGYEDKTHTQVLHTLLLPLTGNLFLWNIALPGILLENPSLIGDALDLAIT